MTIQKNCLQNISFFLESSFYAVMAIGAILAIAQLCLNRSLWLDEAMLALNIIRRSFLELTIPLSYNQVAPIGFLLTEKIFVLMFGKNEVALRLFPLLSFLTSIPLFLLFVSKLTCNRNVALISTSIFSITLVLIDYATEVKQYSLDVLCTIFILYGTLALPFNRNRSLIVYALLGGIAIWFSNISIIVLCVAGFYCIYSEGWKKRNYRILLPVLFWVALFLTYYIIFIDNHPAKNAMILAWHSSFLPLNPFSADFYHFLFIACKDIYQFMSFGPFWPVSLFISAYGIVILFIYRDYVPLYFCLSPILLHLFLSGLTLYPFKGRLILYIIPLIIVLYAHGLYYLFEFMQKSIKILPTCLLIIPVLVMFYPLYKNYPIQKEEIKDGILYIKKHSKEHELIYVYYSSLRAFDFYNEADLINIKNPTIAGSAFRGNNHEYNQELLNLSGKVWLLFSHLYPFDSKDNEENYMLHFLVGSGSTILEVKKYIGCSVYYVDTKRLGRKSFI